KDGVEDWIDRSVEKIGAVPTLNEVLLPAMKEVGDKFGAGELILPFVLQSAEVMKRAVAQLERYLDKIEGYTKGTVVLATVVGDAAINRNFGLRILYPNGRDSDEVYEPGVFYCRDAFEGLAKMDQLIDPDRRLVLVDETREAARVLREKPVEDTSDLPPLTDN